MNVIAINGSPRKTWNTATLLNKALEGAASKGARTEFIHLYDLNYKGCLSCMACKTKGGASYGHCAVRDDLTAVFKKVAQADALILGSPVYFGRVSGTMAAFLDRFLFQYLVYANPPRSLCSKKINTAFIYTMNVSEEVMKTAKWFPHVEINEVTLKRTFGAAESLFCNDTYQFDDYSKVEATLFDVERKAKRRREVFFPVDCQRAFDLGVRLASASSV